MNSNAARRYDDAENSSQRSRVELESRARALLAILKLKGISQAEVGRVAGVSRSAVWHFIHRHVRSPKVEAALLAIGIPKVLARNREPKRRGRPRK